VLGKFRWIYCSCPSITSSSKDWHSLRWQWSLRPHRAIHILLSRVLHLACQNPSAPFRGELRQGCLTGRRQQYPAAGHLHVYANLINYLWLGFGSAEGGLSRPQAGQIWPVLHSFVCELAPKWTALHAAHHAPKQGRAGGWSLVGERLTAAKPGIAPGLPWFFLSTSYLVRACCQYV